MPRSTATIAASSSSLGLPETTRPEDGVRSASEGTTMSAPEALPAYDSVWQPVWQALGPDLAKQVRGGGQRLYA